jgi:hypothetical protein
MANVLSAVMPKILAQGLMALRQQAVGIGLVNSNWGPDVAKKGDTINVPLPSAIAATNVTAANTPPATPVIAPTSVAIALNQWVEAPMYLTDKDLGEIDAGGVINMQVSEAVKALANRVTSDLYAEYKNVYGYVGTAGTTPFGAGVEVASATNVRKTLNRQLAPMSDRRLILDPDAEAVALGLRAFQDSAWRSDSDGIKNGMIGRKLGFDVFMDQLVPTHTSPALSAGALTVNGEHLAGVTTVSLAKATNAGALLHGDIITFAGLSQTFTVTAAATLIVGNTAVSISPALPATVAGGTVVTKVGTHVVNLGFHRDAFALAIRPLEAPGDGLGNLIQSAVDPQTGLALRLEISREHKRTRYSFDILYGVKLVRPELACRLAG